MIDTKIEETKVASLTKEIIDLYYRTRDYQKMMTYFSDQMTYIGVGNIENAYDIKRIRKGIEEDTLIKSEQFNISNEQYSAYKLKNDFILIIAIMDIKTEQESKLILEESVFFSILWHKEKGQWKVIHIHKSFVNHRLQKRQRWIIHEDALIDQLTGISNLDGFINEVEQIFTRAPDQHYAIMKFGVRNFRYVNDVFGYDFGDEVLKNIAKNVKRQCRAGEVCGRVEKDNFAMLLMYDKASFDERMWSLESHLLDQEYRLALGFDLRFMAGVYIIKDPMNEIIKDALDKALIAKETIPKTAVVSKYSVYHEDMHERRIYEAKMIDKIDIAFHNNEFKCYFQPQFDIQTCELTGVEVLSRWIDEKGHMIMPNDYIPFLEQTDYMRDFDLYMLEETCKHIQQWLKEGYNIKPFSINQSRYRLNEDNYIEDFTKIVDSYQIPHELITLELTESVFVGGNQEKIMNLVKKFQERGFTFSLDDFGTGYANMSTISVLMADVLKIDKSMIDGIEENERVQFVIKTIIDMAHANGFIVLCEGIETLEQLELLKQYQCDCGQGFLISRPVDAVTLAKNWFK